MHFVILVASDIVVSIDPLVASLTVFLVGQPGTDVATTVAPTVFTFAGTLEINPPTLNRHTNKKRREKFMSTTTTLVHCSVHS